ncbi:DUF167 domain-containing protein [Patescibacteria group bacterium]|nr:DUF167 domain-containing protein [Patescibacteria group bacterium]
MKILVSVKSGAREDEIEKIDNTHYIISVKERPVKGQANKGVVRVLADYLGVSKSRIKMKSGFTSSEKTLEI